MFSDDLIKVLPDEDEDEVAESISKYNLWALPVVDENEKLLGIVTFDDAFDVIEEDSEETKSSTWTRGALLFIVGIAALIVYTLMVLQIAGYAG